MQPASTRLCSMVGKHGDQTPLTCSSSTAMTAPWSAESVAPKIETKHHQHHYYINFALRILQQSFTVGASDDMDVDSVPCPVSDLSHTLWFLALEGKDGLERRGLNVWNLMSEIVAWPVLTRKAEMHGERVFNIACCCQREKGRRQYPNLKMDIDGSTSDKRFHVTMYGGRSQLVNDNKRMVSITAWITKLSVENYAKFKCYHPIKFFKFTDFDIAAIMLKGELR